MTDESGAVNHHSASRDTKRTANSTIDLASNQNNGATAPTTNAP